MSAEAPDTGAPAAGASEAAPTADGSGGVAPAADEEGSASAERSSVLRRAIAVVTEITETHVVVVWILAVALAVWVMEGSVLHPESRNRLPLYVRKASLFSIVFDAGQDMLPRPRQVSFVFDVVDAHFVRFCAQRGFPHFLSVTHYVFGLFVALALWRFLNRHVTNNRLVSLLITATLLSSRSFEMGTFFRTAKIGAALVVALMINVLADLLAHPPGWRGQSRKLAAYAALMFFLTSVGGLFDEQSVAMTLVFLVLLVGWSIVRRNAVCAAAGGGVAIGLAFVFVYYRWIFPRVFASVNHTPMSYDFQTSVPKGVLTKSAIYSDSAELLLDTAGCLFGNLTRVQVSLGILLVLGIWFVRRRSRKGASTAQPVATNAIAKAADGWTIFLFVAVLGSLWLLNVGLVLKHPPVVWPDVRTAYYWLPEATCLAFLVPWVVARVHQLLPTTTPSRRSFWTALVLVGCVASNVVKLPDHFAMLKSGHLAKEFASTKKFIAALRDPAVAVSTYGSEPVNDLIYVMLKNRHPRTH